LNPVLRSEDDLRSDLRPAKIEKNGYQSTGVSALVTEAAARAGVSGARDGGGCARTVTQLYVGYRGRRRPVG
jgi:hypothetical protein